MVKERNWRNVLVSVVLRADTSIRGINLDLPDNSTEHPIMSFETIEIKMAAVSAKRSMIYK